MEIIKFFNTYINSINGIRAILGVVELMILAGIAIFAYRCFNRVVNINITEKKTYRLRNKIFSILSVSINNISRISLAKPKIIITNFVYIRNLLNYLGNIGIDSIGELVPVIDIEGLDKNMFKLLLLSTIEIEAGLKNYLECKSVYTKYIFFKLYKRKLLKEFVKSFLEKNIKDIKPEEDRKLLIEMLYSLTKELYSNYDVLCEYIKQFKLEKKNLEGFFKYIMSIKSEHILRTSKRINPNENIIVDRFYIFHKTNFMHLGAQLRYGRIKKGRRTSTTFVGL